MPTSTESQTNFLYDKKLLVEYRGHRHARMDSTSLYGILTYREPKSLLTRTGKVAKQLLPPPVDLPLHFYISQLIHYDLPWRGGLTKDAAKEALLCAFDISTKTLAISPRILNIEGSLRKDYLHAVAISIQKEKEEELEERQARDNNILHKFAEAGIIISEQTIHGSDSNGNSNDAHTHYNLETRLQEDVAVLSEVQLREIVRKMISTVPKLRMAMSNELERLSSLGVLPGRASTNGTVSDSPYYTQNV